MQFDSFEYILAFLPLVFIGFLLARRLFPLNCILCGASILFYGWYDLWFVYPMLFSAFLDYFCGLMISRTESTFWRRFYLTVSVVINLGLLGVFKYSGWMAANINAVTTFAGVGAILPVFVLPLPPGISFYTFQTLGYTIDVYRKEYQPQRSILDYMTYVCYFPQLVAGPIERAPDLLPQLTTVPAIPALEAMAGNFFRIAWGLFKKMVIADNLGDLIQHLPVGLPGSGYLFTYAFCFQIYCDFSAYTDIARGSAGLMGVQLTRNFLTPYFSASPSEFWRRWHISLSTCIRDFLYIPLGGSRLGLSRTMSNLLLTMAIAGLWHGAGWTFLFWGVYHGLLLCVYRVCPINEWLTRWLGTIGHVLSVVLMFNLVCVGWALFRAESLQQLLNLSWSVSPLIQGAILTAPFIYFGCLILPVLIADYAAYRNDCEFGDLYPRMSTTMRVALLVLVFYGIVFIGRRLASAFIYFQF